MHTWLYLPYSPLSFYFCPSSCVDVLCWPPGTSFEPGRSGTSRFDLRGPLPYSTASVAVSNISKYYTYLLIKFEGKMCFVILLSKLLPGLKLQNMRNIILHVVIHNFREQKNSSSLFIINSILTKHFFKSKNG